MNICYDTNENFNFDDLSLGNPKSLQGGAHFSKIKINNDPQFIFQTPKCQTKSGIIKTEKKTYCDLMFTNDDDIFLKWLENLEKRIQKLIWEKQHSWFHNDMELEDIEDFYHPSIRIYQGDKYLVRSSINQPRYIQHAVPLQIFDQEENALTIEDINNDQQIICILEVLGIKFTTTSIRTELCLRQIMTLNNSPLFSKCLINLQRKPRKKRLDVLEDTNLVVNTESIQQEEDNNKLDKLSSQTHDKPSQEEINDVTTGDYVQIVKNGKNISDEAESKNPDKVILNEAELFVKTDKDDLAKTDTLKEKVSTKQDIIENINKEDLNVEKENQIKTDVKNELNKKANEDLMIKNVQKDLDKKGTTNQLIHSLPLDKNTLHEVDLAVSDKEPMKLKKPDEVYYEIYYEAKRRAKVAKQKAIAAYLEAKRIKNTYLLNEIDSSDESDNDSLSEINNIS